MFLIPDAWYAVKKTKEKGRSVFAAHDIEAGTIIGDYLGTIIPLDGSDENKNGLYDMAGGLHYDILANPKKNGIHLINHSCANNCNIYPYNGHMFYFALRKIFKGEEITVDYGLFSPDDTTIACNLHACSCGSEICTGTMHTTRKDFRLWDKFLKKQFGEWYKKIPGKYGDQLKPFKKYPGTIKDYPALYDNIFGAEARSAEKYGDKILPALPELRKRIRTTGRQLSFSKLKITVYGIRDGMVLVKR
jgi:hypothetical protein